MSKSHHERRSRWVDRTSEEPEILKPIEASRSSDSLERLCDMIRERRQALVEPRETYPAADGQLPFSSRESSQKEILNSAGCHMLSTRGIVPSPVPDQQRPAYSLGPLRDDSFSGIEHFEVIGAKFNSKAVGRPPHPTKNEKLRRNKLSKKRWAFSNNKKDKTKKKASMKKGLNSPILESLIDRERKKLEEPIPENAPPETEKDTKGVEHTNGATSLSSKDSQPINPDMEAASESTEDAVSPPTQSVGTVVQSAKKHLIETRDDTVVSRDNVGDNTEGQHEALQTSQSNSGCVTALATAIKVSDKIIPSPVEQRSNDQGLKLSDSEVAVIVKELYERITLASTGEIPGKLDEAPKLTPLPSQLDTKVIEQTRQETKVDALTENDTMVKCNNSARREPIVRFAERCELRIVETNTPVEKVPAPAGHSRRNHDFSGISAYPVSSLKSKQKDFADVDEDTRSMASNSSRKSFRSFRSKSSVRSKSSNSTMKSQEDKAKSSRIKKVFKRIFGRQGDVMDAESTCNNSHSASTLTQSKTPTIDSSYTTPITDDDKKALDTARKYMKEARELLEDAATFIGVDPVEVEILTMKAFSYASEAEKVFTSVSSKALTGDLSLLRSPSNSSCISYNTFVEHLDRNERQRRLEGLSMFDLGSFDLPWGGRSIEDTKSLAVETMQILDTLIIRLGIPASASAAQSRMKWLQYSGEGEANDGDFFAFFRSKEITDGGQPDCKVTAKNVDSLRVRQMDKYSATSSVREITDLSVVVSTPYILSWFACWDPPIAMVENEELKKELDETNAIPRTTSSCSTSSCSTGTCLSNTLSEQAVGGDLANQESPRIGFTTLPLAPSSPLMGEKEKKDDLTHNTLESETIGTLASGAGEKLEKDDYTYNTLESETIGTLASGVGGSSLFSNESRATFNFTMGNIFDDYKYNTTLESETLASGVGESSLFSHESEASFSVIMGNIFASDFWCGSLDDEPEMERMARHSQK